MCVYIYIYIYYRRSNPGRRPGDAATAGEAAAGEAQYDILLLLSIISVIYRKAYTVSWLRKA